MPSPLARRRVLAGLALGLPALALTACSSSDAAAVPSDPSALPGPSGSGVRLHTDWTRRPAGAVPVVGDDGVAFRVTREGDAPPPSVVAGALEARLPDARAASSIAQEMRAPVRRLGATFAFGAGSDAGAVTLAAWTAVPYVSAPCQLVLTPHRWTLAVVEQGVLRTVGEGLLDTPLPQDGTTPSTVEITVAGNTATLALPGGGSATATDARVGAILGTVPSWGFYADAPGAAAGRYFRTWAG